MPHSSSSRSSRPISCRFSPSPVWGFCWRACRCPGPDRLAPDLSRACTGARLQHAGELDGGEQSGWPDGAVLPSRRALGGHDGALAAIPLRLDRRALSAFMLVVVCSNSGNYGLPVALLAFGREALTFASVYFVASSIFSYTGGVLLAASGRRSLRDALAGIARVPAVYGAMAAALTSASGSTLPGAVMRADHAAQRRRAADDDSRARHAARAGVTAGTPRRGRGGSRCLADPHAARRAGHRAPGRTCRAPRCRPACFRPRCRRPSSRRSSPWNSTSSPTS